VLRLVIPTDSSRTVLPMHARRTVGNVADISLFYIVLRSVLALLRVSAIIDIRSSLLFSYPSPCLVRLKPWSVGIFNAWSVRHPGRLRSDGTPSGREQAGQGRSGPQLLLDNILVPNVHSRGSEMLRFETEDATLSAVVGVGAVCDVAEVGGDCGCAGSALDWTTGSSFAGVVDGVLSPKIHFCTSCSNCVRSLGRLHVSDMADCGERCLLVYVKLRHPSVPFDMIEVPRLGGFSRCFTLSRQFPLPVFYR